MTRPGESCGGFFYVRRSGDPEIVLEHCHCAHCGGTVGVFVSSGLPRKYCSADCREAGNRYHVKLWREKRRGQGQRISRPARNCAQCGGTFEQLIGRGRRKKYCSAKCRHRAKHVMGLDRERENCQPRSPHPCLDCGVTVSAGARRCRECNGKRVTAMRDAQHVHTCKRCGKEYVNRRRNKGEGEKYCSRFCAADAKRKPKRAPFCRVNENTCRSCRKVFIGRAVKYCSIACSNLASLDSAYRSAFRKFLQRRSEPAADHIVPLAAGGSHTYDNTQCLCRLCNQLKSDMPMQTFAERYGASARR